MFFNDWFSLARGCGGHSRLYGPHPDVTDFR